MAEFIQTMKDWRRTCKFFSNKGMADGNNGCKNICPLGHNDVCGFMRDATDRDIEDAVNAIVQWASENQEVYPTWWEYLIRFGITGMDQPAHSVIYKLKNWRISADIAEKLELEPW